MIENRRAWVIVAIGLLMAVGGSLVVGQFLQPSRDVDLINSQTVPQNRRVQVVIDQAREELKQEEIPRGSLALLQQAIDGMEDAFADDSLNSTLKHEAELILSQLPAQGRRLYEETVGAEAKSLLQRSRETGSRDQKLEVVRRFLLTQAGGEAAYELAVAEMDCGEFLAAARRFDRLRTLHNSRSQWEPVLSERTIIAYWQAGLTRQAAEILLEAVADTPRLFESTGSRPDEISTLAVAADWLKQTYGTVKVSSVDVSTNGWPMTGGTAGHNASVRPTTPVFDDAWRTSLIGLPDVRTNERFDELQAIIDNLQPTVARNEDFHAFPVSEPLVVGNTLILSTYGRLKAVDIRTGEFRWQAADTEPVFEFLLTGMGTSSTQGRMPTQSSISDFLAQRAWLDATSASLSSDGEHVFEVFNAGMIGPFHSQVAAGGVEGHPLSPRPYNRLRAYDIGTEGKLLWEVGGPNSRVSLPLAGTFFLGSPLPVDGLLYVLGEERGQVRLFVLEPVTGEMQWSLPLLNASSDINEDLERRLAGLSPAYAEGLVICPTGSRLIVAVDPIERAFVWGKFYNPDPPQPTVPDMIGGFRPGQLPSIETTSTDSLLEESRWHGPATVIADQFVLVAPPDDASIHCLNLADGTARWSLPRQRRLFIAGSHSGSVILVGERAIEAVRLDSAELVWSLPIDAPCGRGVRVGHLYHLPIEGSRIATIDLNDGQLLAESPTRTAAELGNLIAVQGRLLTQTTSEVRGFRSLDELEQQIAADLASNEHDPAALAVRGEMRLHAGRTSDGLDDLRASLAVAPDDRAQALLVETLLEQLRTDFAANQSTIPELERLVVGPAQQIRLLRTTAAGLESVGELRQAFRQYLQLLRFDEITEVTEHLSDNWSARLDRWVQGQLLRMSESTSAEDREALDRNVSDAIASAVDAAQVNALMRFAATFRSQPGGAQAEEALVDLLDPQVSPLRAEALYLRRREQGSPEQRANATARLVRLYAGHDQGTLVHTLLGELATQFADVPTWDATTDDALTGDAMTGAEVVEAWKDDEALVAVQASVMEWPREPAQIKKALGGSRGVPATLHSLGPVDPLIGAGGFMMHSNAQLSHYDADGRIEWIERLQSRTGIGLPETYFTRRRGHRALVFLGQHFLLLNVLTRENLVTILDDAVTGRSRNTPFGRLITRPQQVRRGMRGDLLLDQETGEYFGSVGPIGDEVFCYQHADTLSAVDPYNGDHLWSIDNVPQGSELFGDDEYIVLVPRGPANEPSDAFVYRAADGELITRQRMPSQLVSDRQEADWGRMFLTRQREADGVTLAMFDPVTGRNRWEKAFPKFIDWMPLDGRDLVVVEEDGRVEVLRAEDGEVQFETEVEIPEDVRSLSVHSLPEAWILFSFRRPDQDEKVRGLLPERTRNLQVVNGMAHAFDRRTHEKLWSREIPRQVLDPSLPGRWPMLVLATTAQIVDRPTQVSPPFLSLLLIDRRTGETLFEGEGNGGQPSVGWDISGESPQMRLIFGTTELHVTFGEASDADTDPEADTDTTDEPASRSVGDEPARPLRRPPSPPPPPPPEGPED